MPTVTTGEMWSASSHNTFVRENFESIWKYRNAGDIVYALDSTTLDNFPIGPANSYLKMKTGLLSNQFEWTNHKAMVNLARRNPQTISLATWTAIRFDTAISNNYNMWRSSYPYAIYIPTDYSVWAFDAHVEWTHAAGQPNDTVEISVAPSGGFSGSISRVTMPMDVSVYATSVSGLIYGDADTAILVQVYQGGNATKDVINATFSMNYVGRS